MPTEDGGDAIEAHDGPGGSAGPGVTPQAETAVASQETATPPGETRRGGRAALVLALGAVVIALGVLGGGYYLWRQSVAVQGRLEARLERLGEEVAVVPTRLDALREALDALDARLHAELARELTVRDEQLARLRDAGRREPVAESAAILQLLTLANDRLVLAHDVDTALLALQTADQRLQALDDPRFAETRRRLAREITALAALPRPDISGMAFTLGSLQAEIDALPAGRPAPRDEGATDGAPETAPAPGPGRSGWRAFLSDLWEAIKGLVVIRRDDDEDAVLLAPGQRAALNLNLQLTLESARFALIARDDRNFHAGLRRAREWLTRYYDTADPAVAAVIARLDELDRVDITPRAADISASLEALRTALGLRPGRAVPGPGTPSGEPAPAVPPADAAGAAAPGEAPP